MTFVASWILSKASYELHVSQLGTMSRAQLQAEHSYKKFSVLRTQCTSPYARKKMEMDSLLLQLLSKWYAKVRSIVVGF